MACVDSAAWLAVRPAARLHGGNVELGLLVGLLVGLLFDLLVRMRSSPFCELFFVVGLFFVNGCGGLCGSISQHSF